MYLLSTRLFISHSVIEKESLKISKKFIFSEGFSFLNSLDASTNNFKKLDFDFFSYFCFFDSF